MKQLGKIMANLNDNEKEAVKILQNIRKDNITHGAGLQDILKLLGSDYKISNSTLACALIIAHTETHYGSSVRRDVILASLDLLAGYEGLSLTERRNKLAEEKYYNRIQDSAIRKKEDIYFEDWVSKLTEELNNNTEYINVLIKKSSEILLSLF